MANRRNNRNNNNSNQKVWDGIKRSSFEKLEGKKGHYFKGWSKAKIGFIVISAFPYKNSPEHKTKSGKRCIGLMCKIDNLDTGGGSTPDAWWYPDEEKLRIDACGGITCSLKGSGQTAKGKHVKGSVSFTRGL